MRYARLYPFRTALCAVVLLTSSMALCQGGEDAKTEHSYWTRELCERTLSTGSLDRFEQAIVDNSSEPGPALQILRHYGVFFTKEMRSAILAALKEQGVIDERFSAIDKDTAANYAGGIVQGLLDLSALPIAEFSLFVWKVLEKFEALVTLGPDQAKARIQHSQVKNLLDAIRGSPNRAHFETLIGSYIRTTLLLTAQEVLKRKQEAKDERVDGVGAVALWTVGAGLIGGFIGGVAGSFIWVLGQVLTSGDSGNWFPWAFWGVKIAGSVSAVVVGFLTSRDAYGRKKDPLVIDKKKKAGFQARIGEIDPKYHLRAESTDEQKTTVSVLSLYEEPRDSISSQHLSLISAGRSASLAQRTPVQIAYLGHLEKIEIHALNNRLVSLMHGMAEEEIQPARRAAEELWNSPDVFRRRVEFKAAIKSLSEYLRGGLNDLNDILRKTRETLKAVQGELKALNELPYRDSISWVAGDGLPQVELLVSRLEGDLAPLNKIELSDDHHTAVRREFLEARLKRIDQILDSANRSDSDWKKLAEDAVTVLDEIAAQ